MPAYAFVVFYDMTSSIWFFPGSETYIKHYTSYYEFYYDGKDSQVNSPSPPPPTYPKP